MTNLEKLTMLTSEISTLEGKLAAAKTNHATYAKAYMDWNAQAQKTCTGIGKKKSDCEADKQFKAGKAAEYLGYANTENANIAQLSAALTAKKSEFATVTETQDASNQAAVTLAQQGLTQTAVDNATEAQSQAVIIKASTEAENAAKAAENAEKQKANRNRLFLFIGIFLFLVLVFFTVRHFRKQKSK